VLTDSGKVGYLDARQELFHELVATLVQQRRDRDALTAAEAARGRAFSDLLASRAARTPANDQRLLASITHSEAQLRSEAGLKLEDRVVQADLERTRAATMTKIDTQLRSLRDEDQELASLVVAEPISATEIAQTAKRLHATMVEYLVTREQLFIWVMQP